MIATSKQLVISRSNDDYVEILLAETKRRRKRTKTKQDKLTESFHVSREPGKYYSIINPFVPAQHLCTCYDFRFPRKCIISPVNRYITKFKSVKDSNMMKNIATIQGHTVPVRKYIYHYQYLATHKYSFLPCFFFNYKIHFHK